MSNETIFDKELHISLRKHPTEDRWLVVNTENETGYSIEYWMEREEINPVVKAIKDYLNLLPNEWEGEIGYENVLTGKYYPTLYDDSGTPYEYSVCRTDN